MYRRQQGVSMMGLLVIVVIVVVGAIGGMKVAPAYLEFYKVKKAVTSIAGGGGAATVADVRKAFERRAAVDDIEVVGGQDLEITKEGGEIVVSFAYVKKVPLFSNISLLIEFSGSSNR